MAEGAEPAPSVRNFGFDVRVAWRRDDPEIEADAIDFWARNALLSPDVDPARRAKELIAAAYKDGKLASVATATLSRIDMLRARFAVLRGATDKDFRRSHAQLALAAPSREALTSWSLAHPEEKIAGAIAFVGAAEWGDFARLPVWPESGLALAGYDRIGRQVRLRWFDHFRLDGPGGEGAPPPYPPSPPLLPEEVVLRPAWQLRDRGIEQDAVAFWRRLGNLPADVTPEERATEAVVAAYQGGRMIGVATAALEVLPQVRARLAMMRASVDPEFRRGHVSAAMGISARALLESWSADNPEECLAGIGGIVESPDLAIVQRMPYWPWPRMNLIGFTADGRQIRVSWFEDFRLD